MKLVNTQPGRLPRLLGLGREVYPPSWDFYDTVAVLGTAAASLGLEFISSARAGRPYWVEYVRADEIEETAALLERDPPPAVPTTFEERVREAAAAEVTDAYTMLANGSHNGPLSYASAIVAATKIPGNSIDFEVVGNRPVKVHLLIRPDEMQGFDPNLFIREREALADQREERAESIGITVGTLVLAQGKKGRNDRLGDLSGILPTVPQPDSMLLRPIGLVHAIPSM